MSIIEQEEKSVNEFRDHAKLMAKGTEIYKSFIEFLKFNSSKGPKMMLAVDQWALCTQEQFDKIEGEKPKLLKFKFFKDEFQYLNLVKDHSKFTEIGSARHYLRFNDFSETDLAKGVEISAPSAYLNWINKNKPVVDEKKIHDESSSVKNSVSKSDNSIITPSEKQNESSLSKNEDSSSSELKDLSNSKIAPFSRSAKVFDDEVYTIIGSLECSKINYIKGEVAYLKEQLFNTEKQLEGVHNVLFMALTKLGLIDPNAKTPFQRDIQELCYSDSEMKKLTMKARERKLVAKIIDELQGKESKSSNSNFSAGDDIDKNDYELYGCEDKISSDDPLGKEIRCQENERRAKQKVDEFD